LGKPKQKKNTTKLRLNTFGFYALNGNSVIDFKERSRKEDVCEFLELIRKHNPKKEIILQLDNFPSHWANKTKEKAEELGITLIFQPPYSPDLNPIEFIWKSIKRELSPLLIESIDMFENVIKDYYESFAQKTSYAKSWIKKFLPDKFKKLCH